MVHITKRPNAIRPWTRGAKTKSSVKITAEPQGALPASEPVASEEPDLPELLQSVRKNMNTLRHCVVLTRVGNFYEMYFEHADEYAPLLDIKKAKRTIKQRDGTKRAVPMAGFPFFQLERYLKILVQDLHRHVAVINEEGQGPDMPKKRYVERIITPGTLIDEKFMQPLENNFLLSIQLDSVNRDDTIYSSRDVGLAWLDLSSGEFFTQRTTLEGLSTAIARIAPREILLDEAQSGARESPLDGLVHDTQYTISFVPPVDGAMAFEEWLAALESSEGRQDTSKYSDLEKTAAVAIVHYVKDQLQDRGTQLPLPSQENEEDLMTIDRNTLRALEIRETSRDRSFQGSLLHAVRHTKTKSGARLLSQRLSAPSLSIAEINNRLDLVAELNGHTDLLDTLVQCLGKSSDYDTIRLLQKFILGHGDADDLLDISSTIHVMQEIRQHLYAHCEGVEHASPCGHAEQSTKQHQPLESLLERLSLERSLKLAQRIRNTIDEGKVEERRQKEAQEAAGFVDLADSVLQKEGEAPLKGVPRDVQAHVGRTGAEATTEQPSKESWIMRPTASAALQKLHNALENLRDEEAALQAHAHTELGKGVTLRWVPGLEYICHVKGSVKDEGVQATLGKARLVRSSKSTKTYLVDSWTKLGERIDRAKDQIVAEEKRVFADLRTRLVRNIVQLRKNAAVLDELDVACSFARLAQKHQLVRPILNKSRDINLVGGRHPTVEGGLTKQGRNFTANDCFMSDEEQILLITGPNMGGKSTFLRQVALIAILAQTGSFVPAAYAELGLVDKLFSRIGSADNLYEDQSTFMVEMLETADILRQATDRSLVIMDEVGRGTTPEDGIAVGFAALHHLYHVNKCRVLFATHFHALTDMASQTKGISCYCTDVQEETDGTWAFSHRLRKGINRQSHALKVAGLAGMPRPAIDVARSVLDRLKQNGVSNTRMPQLNQLELV